MKAKHILPTILTLFSAMFIGSPVMALTAQEEAALEFTFNPNVNLSVVVSDDTLLVGHLVPGTSGLSNSATITVTTNCVSGYQLYAAVGDSGSNNTRNLVMDSSNYIESVAVDANLSVLPDDTWGYTTNNGASFSGLAIYATPEPNNAWTLLNSSNSPVTSGEVISFAVGAKASASKTAGTYSNVITFAAVAPPLN